MKALFATAAVFVAISLCSSALAHVPSFPKDEPYAKARKVLLKKGWKPVHAPEAGICLSKRRSALQGTTRDRLLRRNGERQLHFPLEAQGRRDRRQYGR